MYARTVKFSIVGMELRSMNTFRDAVSDILKCAAKIEDFSNSDFAVFDMDSCPGKGKTEFL